MLGLGGTANSYIITSPGTYSFPCVKGSSCEPVGEVSAASVLWSKPSASADPSVTLVDDLACDSTGITFCVRSPFVEGNVLVSALDARGRVLWSWHLWLTDAPSERIYAGGAGVAMDRNLGALSTAWLDPDSQGLMYQWGRKDPFAAGLYDTVSSDGKHGTADYARQHPATFICGNSFNRDWLFPGHEVASASWSKSVEDPCPPGWMLPGAMFWKDSGECGVYGSEQTGIILIAGARSALPLLEEAAQCHDAPSGWYPSAGYLDWQSGEPAGQGMYGFYWSGEPQGELADQMYFFRTGYANMRRATFRSYGAAVRCVKQQ